jgi:hypothetical protein
VQGERSYLPTQVSMKKYTPIIYPQETGNCVAQSFANALNILIAKENNLTDKESITILRPSPFFIYYSNKAKNDYDCQAGLDAEKAAVNILNMGVVPMMTVEYPNYYPFTNQILCNTYPPVYAKDVSNAAKMKPSNIYKIESLLDIKVALANNMPVVIGMIVPPSFMECKSYIWRSRPTDKIDNSYGHAMTIVGYDDNSFGGSFEIMNSWGEDWGINGFTRIRYSDAANWIVAGWAFERKSNSTYKFDGDFREKYDSIKPNEDMIKIFSESRNDTLVVNPFFQRTDLKELMLKIE